MFIKDLQTPNGLLTFHKITNISSGGDLSSITINVASWPTQDDYLLGNPAAFNTQVLKPFLPDYVTGITTTLLDDGIFAGANLVNTDTLVIAKANQWAKIKNDRDTAEYSPVTFEAKLYDADAESTVRVIGANVIMLQKLMNWAVTSIQKFSATAPSIPIDSVPTDGMDWTDYNNETISLSLAEVQGLGLALAMQSEVAHTIGRTLRTQIESAATVEDVEKVSWPNSTN